MQIFGINIDNLIRIFCLDTQTLLIFVTVLLVIATFLLCKVTKLLKDTADLQLTTSLTGAFQDEWHSRVTRLMREYLSEKKFFNKFNKAIKEAYERDISYTNIAQLLEPPPDLDDALNKFKQCLNNDIFHDPATKSSLFTTHEALNQVLVIFDRLALVRNEPQAIKIIKQYKPPIRDLKDVLQAFIAVRITLTKDEEKKNFKKDYMLLLYKLCLYDKDLFDSCKSGLKKRNELTDKELKKEKKIRKKYYI